MDSPAETASRFAHINERFTLLDERIDALDGIVAHLFQGYVELATMVESVIAEMLTPLEPDAAQAFTTRMAEHRREMFAMVKGVADGIVAGDADAAMDDQR